MGLSAQGWHIISVSPPKQDGHWYEPFIWCSKMIPKENWNFHGEGVFEFRNEQDLLLFILKWSDES